MTSVDLHPVITVVPSKPPRLLTGDRRRRYAVWVRAPVAYAVHEGYLIDD
jgi:hypothetical protein